MICSTWQNVLYMWQVLLGTSRTSFICHIVWSAHVLTPVNDKSMSSSICLTGDGNGWGDQRDVCLAAKGMRRALGTSQDTLSLVNVYMWQVLLGTSRTHFICHIILPETLRTLFIYVYPSNEVWYYTGHFKLITGEQQVRPHQIEGIS